MNAGRAVGLAGIRDATRDGAQALFERGNALVGGPARARVIVILAAILGLQGADFATVSATAGDLQRVFGINNTAIGLLVSVTALAGALGTIPIHPALWGRAEAIRTYPRDVATAAESYRRQPITEAS
jgi:hypothetical protein